MTSGSSSFSSLDGIGSNIHQGSRFKVKVLYYLSHTQSYRV